MTNEIKKGLPKVFYHIGEQEKHDGMSELTVIENPAQDCGVIANTQQAAPIQRSYPQPVSVQRAYPQMAPIQMPYPNMAPIQMPYLDIVDAYSMADIARAGISFKQAQDLNVKRQSNLLELEKKMSEHQLELGFMEQKYLLNQKYRGMNVGFSDGGYVEGENFGAMPLNIPSLLEGFRNKYHIVKERLNGSLEWRYLIREVDGLRHIPCDEKELNEFFIDFIEETAGNFELNKAESKSLFEKLKRRYIPKVDKSDLELIPDSSLVFKNGILDICTNSFSTSAPAQRFNRFAMEQLDYPKENKAPEAFDALLDEIFHGNAEWKHLCYQIIGALLSPVATLKRIYVFQGVSNAGKTRLSNIIMSMLNEMDVMECNTLSDITMDKATQLRHIRLVYIKETANKKISSKQIAFLKSYADGGRSVNRATFKILVGTNYKLTTGDDGELESALRNRFIVLPFPNPMTNEDPRVESFEYSYFEKEKQYIARKALEAFSEVLRNDGRFCCEPEINKYIADVDDGITGGESASKQDAMATVEKWFTVGDTLNMELSMQDILETLQAADPGSFSEMSASSLSRILKERLKDRFLSKRIHNVTRYNLFLK